MGCDIHLEVEIRRDGEWRRVPHPLKQCWACGGSGFSRAGRSNPRGSTTCYRCAGTKVCATPFYADRDYDVFAILANVRNATWGGPFNPIASPRGIPDDASSEIRDCYQNDGCPPGFDYESDDEPPSEPSLGEHSWSWLTVREILDFDWSQTGCYSATVTAEEYLRWKADGDVAPKGYSAGAFGERVVYVQPHQIGTTGMHEYLIAEWRESYEKIAASFLRMMREDLVPLGEPDDVRVVFGFDS